MPTAAANEPLSFSVSPLAGTIWGQGEEILFKYRDRDQRISELLWDLKPLFYVGMAADVGPSDPFRGSGFSAAASAKFGVPMRTGIMEDRDWQYMDNDRLTNYSQHDANTQSAVLTDVSLGYSFMLSSFLALRFFGEFSYMHFNWMAEDGFIQYLPTDDNGNILPGQTWTPNIPKIPIYGPGIRYIQDWYILTPGLSLSARFSEFLGAGINIRYTPLVFGNDRDDHLFGMRIFSGEFRYGQYLDGGANLTLSPSDRLDFSVLGSFRHISGMRGENTVLIGGIGSNIFTGISFINPFDAGAGYWGLDIGLKARMRF